MASIRQPYSCSLDNMNHVLSHYDEDWVAAGAPMKGSYQTPLFLLEEI
jgi:hypothetical protein